jgi:hypothetical protein
MVNMKKINAPAFFFLALFFLLSIQSCGSNKEKLLLRTWQLENLKYTKEVPPALQPTIDRQIEVMKQSFRLTYNADGTYNTLNGNQKMVGKWKLNWSSSEITSTDDAGVAVVFKIKTLTENNFDFEAIVNKEKVIFMMIPEKK